MTTRRGLLAAGVAGLFGLRAAPVMSDSGSDPCARPPSVHPEIFFRRSFHLPQAMQDIVFWGYKPNPEAPRDEKILRRYGVMLLNYKAAMERDNAIDLKVETVEKNECGQIFISADLVPLSPPEQEQRVRISSVTKAFLDQIKEKSPEEQFEAKIVFLTASFRGVVYEMSTDWQTIPLSPGELLHARKGDCKDFAFSRYLLARELGMDPDHLQIVVYDSRNPDRPGHANLAVFNPHASTWIMIDGTGRHPWQEMGSVLSYENHPDVYDALAGNYIVDDAVPFAGITNKGVYFFDSIEAYPDGQYPVFKNPLPIPHPGDRPIHFLIDDAHFYYPTMDGPQLPVLGQGFGPR